MRSLFADLSPMGQSPSPGEAQFFYWFVGAVVVCLTLIVGILTIIHLSRRKPSIEQEFATKEEMRTAKAEFSAALASLSATIQHVDRRNEELAKQMFAEIKLVNSSINHGLQEVHRSIGRLEGQK